MPSTLDNFNLENWDYFRAFSRNLGLLSKEEQLRIRDLRVGIPGLGGVGGSHLITLARSGVQNFSLAEFDTFELQNFNRQYGAFLDTVGKAKLTCMMSEVKRINPQIKFQTFPEGLNLDNLDNFLKSVDIVIDSLDVFSIKIRRALFKRADELGVVVVNVGPIAFGASFISFAPGKGMSAEKYFNFKDSDSEQDLLHKFILGVSPKLNYFKYIFKDPNLNLTQGNAPSAGLACAVCSGIAAMEVIKIHLNKGNVKLAPHSVRFDLYYGKLYRKYLPFGNKGPLQRLKLFALKKILARKSLDKAVISRGNTNRPSSFEMNRELLTYFTECAVQAPSGDNSQHWKFKLGKDSITILEDSSRSMFDYSVNNLAQYLAYGAAAENIKLAAESFGYQTKFDFIGSGEEVCNLVFSHVGCSEDALFPYLEFRHTNRGLYNRKPVEMWKQDRIKNAAESISGTSLELFSDSKEKDILRGLVVKSDRYLWKDQDLHADLFKWVRFKEDSRDGMGLEVLGLDFHEKIIFPLVKKWSTLKVMNLIGFNFLVGLKSYKQISSSPMLALLSAKDQNLSAYFDAGRALTRFWICANSLGLSVQPMTSSVMLMHMHLFQGKDSKAIYKECKEVYSQLINLDKMLPVMLFRLGYGPSVVKRSGRRAVSEVIKIDN